MRSIVTLITLRKTDGEAAPFEFSLDTVGVSHARTVLDVVEEKGGTAGLGTRKDDHGVEVEQAQPAYLNRMLHVDPEVTAHFQEHPEDSSS